MEFCEIIMVLVVEGLLAREVLCSSILNLKTG